MEFEDTYIEKYSLITDDEYVNVNNGCLDYFPARCHGCLIEMMLSFLARSQNSCLFGHVLWMKSA